MDPVLDAEGVVFSFTLWITLFRLYEAISTVKSQHRHDQQLLMAEVKAEAQKLTAEKAQLENTIDCLERDKAELNVDKWNLTLFNLFTITLSVSILYFKW